MVSASRENPAAMKVGVTVYPWASESSELSVNSAIVCSLLGKTLVPLPLAVLQTNALSSELSPARPFLSRHHCFLLNRENRGSGYPLIPSMHHLETLCIFVPCYFCSCFRESLVLPNLLNRALLSTSPISLRDLFH